MLVDVRLNDGSSISPIFDPSHKSEVTGFYALKYWNREIAGYQITMDNGEIVAIGSYLAEKVGV